MVIDPRDGQKIFSIVGIERKLGRRSNEVSRAPFANLQFVVL